LYESATGLTDGSMSRGVSYKIKHDNRFRNGNNKQVASQQVA